MTIGRTAPVAHYAGEVETIDAHRQFMRDALGETDGDVAFAAHCLANAREYMSRADRKGQRESDIAKARWYLDMCAHILAGTDDPRAEQPGWVDPWPEEPWPSTPMLCELLLQASLDWREMVTPTVAP